MGDDEFIFELEMFEAGGIADFLAERWEMIPADERDVYELWVQATLALWEVVSVGDGTVELRDTLTGDNRGGLRPVGGGGLRTGRLSAGSPHPRVRVVMALGGGHPRRPSSP